MVIAALLRGEYRRYPFVFLYAVVDFLTTILEIPARNRVRFAALRKPRSSLRSMFWWDERIMQVLVFLLVISLVYKATEHLGPRRTLLTGDHLRHRAGGGDFVLGSLRSEPAFGKVHDPVDARSQFLRGHSRSRTLGSADRLAAEGLHSFC